MNYISTLKLLSLVAVFTLTGCADPDSNFAAAPAAQRSTSAHKATVHSIGHGGAGQVLSSIGGPYIRSIQRAGGVVIKRGQILRIVLPYSRFFISDDANHIKVAQRPALLAIAKLLNNRYPSAPIRVIGYTDSSGTYSQQVARGRQTGGVVYSYLWDHNVSPQRMTLISGGASNPIGSDAGFFAGWSDNRRVEVRVGLLPA